MTATPLLPLTVQLMGTVSTFPEASFATAFACTLCPTLIEVFARVT
jgi:hypothetical protein